MITEDTAHAIAFAYREIAVAEKLLEEISEALARRGVPDIRDAFGRGQHGLELGVPTGDMSKRLFRVEWALAKPVLEAHVASLRAQLGALNEKARAELDTPATP